MPTITISFPNVLVDGTSYGKICDTIANNKALASDIQRALETWNSEQAAAAASAIKTAQDATAAVQVALATLKTQAGAFLQSLSTVDHPEVQAAVQSATVELNKDETQKKKDALTADIAAKQAELAKL